MAETPREAGRRLTQWAECVQRLIAVAPTQAIIEETGIPASGHATPPERKALREQAHAVVASWLARDLAALATGLPAASGTCWFCKGEFVVDALIAGYDTFEESRLACLACNERMSGNWRPSR